MAEGVSILNQLKIMKQFMWKSEKAGITATLEVLRNLGNDFHVFQTG